MIRQPSEDERAQIIPLILTIMEDMELPILKEVFPSTLHTMLEEAMLQENFRYSLTNTLVFINCMKRTIFLLPFVSMKILKHKLENGILIFSPCMKITEEKELG